MGKRKYDSGEVKTPKRSRTDEISSENDIISVQNEQPQTQPDIVGNKSRHFSGGFDIKHFRKELTAKSGHTMALTQFLQVCMNPDNNEDYILEYLKCGGNSHEILRQISQENKKNLTLATPVFHLFHLIILKVQSSLPHMITITEEACRYFLNTFISTAEIMISENSGPRHRKIILKLFTSMVTLNPDLGIEVLNQAPLTPKNLQYIADKSNYKEKENVRTTFVHFMTSFLIDGHLPLIKALLEKQGLIALVIPGLMQDEAEAVMMFLNILKKNVIDNTFISKSLKLKTFSHQVLHNIFKLYLWKGPSERSNDVGNESHSEIINLLSDIILTLFTSHKVGLYFTDSYLGTTDVNKNQNLYKALLTLKRPWENKDECEVILQIVQKCPDLHRAIMNVVEQSFEPQHSPIWEKTTEFVIKLLNVLKPEVMVPRMGNLNTVQVANFVRFITLPVPLLKFIHTNLGKDITISLYCVKVLVKMLETLRRYIQILEMEDSHAQVTDLRNRLEYFFPKHMPAPSIIVSLIQDVISGKDSTEKSQDYRLTKVDDASSLINLIDLLLLYNDIHPAFFETLEGSLDMKKLLDYSTNLSSDNTSLLKFKIVSLWLTLDNSAISLKNPIFKDLFHIMLQVYTSDTEDTWIEAKETLYKFFKNTAIFETDEDEIHIMLYTLRNTKVNPTSLVGDIVEYVLSNIKELTEYVRNQIINYNVSDENSEEHLDKLFKDLMENKSTEKCVFLDNKIPSPFIVGCIQYIQNNRNAKKNLKHFISVYIVNLLHCNYSPELTDILIGDSKLDVRDYVASWKGHPVPLSDNITEKDNVLRNISKSIIGGEEISLKDIFPMLEQKSTEESDIILNKMSFKVNVSRNINNSQLLVWAQYLLFCTVTLSNMKQLKEEHLMKITDYFECLIVIGKKHHMIDVCRTIILSLFKNRHVLKIYRPIDYDKDPSSIEATKFLLQIIAKHSDIVNFLNIKHKLLRPYQQKNSTEILKAFIKINNKKNSASNHTIKVLEMIGLTDEDDLMILHRIFNTDINACVKDDKEPNIVLEILQVLIEKYSKLTAVELSHNMLKKCLKLYTDLLTAKDIAPNLTNLENALILYFENKPYQVKCVTEDNFKQFFNAGTVRKTTAHLASTILKYSYKFCNIFKEQINRPEILSQRELTLPLGNAILSHNQFLIDNKEFMFMIFNEYKTNIIKILEKPHKIGQMYITCWKFIRKLVLECMELQDCKKFCMKSYKFDTVELCHVHLLHAIFLKVILLEEVDKKVYIVNYYLSMLHIVTTALKEAKDANILNVIISNIYSASKMSDYFNIEDKTQFKKVTESSVWQNFCKTVLKDSLKVRTIDQVTTCGPQLLFLLSTLVKLFYSSDHEDIVMLFDMVTSHSEFVNVMLSHHSPDIKSRLIEFLYVLIIKNNAVMKSQQIPVYLSAYHATRSPCDRLILSILHYYETHEQPVNEYKPYVWGDSAANHYAVRKNRTSSLWAHPTPNQVLSLFEKDVLERTVRNFPITQELNYNFELSPNIHVTKDNIHFDGFVKTVLDKMSIDGVFKMTAIKDTEAAVNELTLKVKYSDVISELKDKDLASLSHLKECEDIYDPACLFPLLSHLLAPGSVASCFKILRSGFLSVPVMALSSHCPMMRAAAYHVLHRFCMLLETETRHKNDKLLLTDFIETLRHSLSSAITTTENADNLITDMKNPKLPAVDALYLAKALMVYTAPFDPLYKPVNNYLIAKQFVDLTVVPDFLSLFHDSDVEASDRRNWILDIVKHGCKSMTDVNVIFKTMCLKLIMDFYCSVLSDRKTRERILGVVCSVVSIPRAVDILIEGYSLLSWLHAAVSKLERDDRSLVKSILSVIKNALYSIEINSFLRNINSVKNENKIKQFRFLDLKVNKDVEYEILMLLYDILQHVGSLETEDIVSYVLIYKMLSRKTIKLLSQKQILNLVSECCFSSECRQLLSKAVVSNNIVMLKCKNLYEISNNNDFVETILTKELVALVQNYLL